jgi:fluoride exporter
VILALGAAFGAAFGAVARYLVDRAVAWRHDSIFPAGTWLINVTGSFVLGLLTGLATHHGLPEGALVTLGTGVCGGYTTFSTFSFESLRLMEDGAGLVALANFAGSIAAGLVAAALGMGLGAL